MNKNGIALSCALLLAMGLALGVGAGPIVDSDGDGVINELDNCTNQSNPTQCDADIDGYGNHCDGDFLNIGSVGLTEFGIFRSAFNGAYDSNVDMDCDNAIGLGDFGLFRASFQVGAPGPSGLSCAGNAACSAF